MIQIFNRFINTVPPAEITVFSRQAATLLSAGIPLIQTLDIIAKTVRHKTFKMHLRSIQSALKSGQSFSGSLAQHPTCFTPLVCHLVAAGELSGTLDTMLNTIAAYLEKRASLKRRVIKALAYPVVVLIVAFVISCILLISIVPQFERMYHSFDAELPRYTQCIIHLSHFGQQFGGVISMSIILSMLFIIYTYRQFMPCRIWLDKRILHLPLLGGLLTKAVITRFASTMATTLGAGIPLLQCLSAVANATGNAYAAKAIHRMKSAIAQGSSIHIAMRNTGLFSTGVIQMIAVGEEAGAIEAMLHHVASLHESEVDQAVAILSHLLEPTIMAILGIMVGGLVIAMYLPIFQLGSIIS